MIFEIGSTIVMAAVGGYAYLKTDGPATNDADKIQKIFNNSGLVVREDKKVKTIRLHRKRKIEGGMEYVYQLPLGMSSQDIINRKDVLEDGLNVRHKTTEFDIKGLLKYKWEWNHTIFQQMKRVLTTTKMAKKEIDIEFDGMLKIRVFNEKMKDSYTWDESYLKHGTWSVPIGVTRHGVVSHNFDEHKHLIIAGATGFGKSAVLKLIVTSLTVQQSEHAHLHLIDLKGGSAFQRFENLKQVDHFTREPSECYKILEKIQKKMNADYKAIVDSGYEDVKESGIKDRHFIIIDEAADIADDADCMDIVTDIARRGRGAGYYLIYATQYPSSKSIPQQTKRNIPSRLCFVLDDAIASNTALGQTGAEDLPMIPGRGIYKNVKSQIVQSPFINNKQIQEQITPHIVIKPREDETDGQKSDETTEDRKHSFKFKKV